MINIGRKFIPRHRRLREGGRTGKVQDVAQTRKHGRFNRMQQRTARTQTQLATNQVAKRLIGSNAMSGYDEQAPGLVYRFTRLIGRRHFSLMS